MQQSHGMLALQNTLLVYKLLLQISVSVMTHLCIVLTGVIRNVTAC